MKKNIFLLLVLSVLTLSSCSNLNTSEESQVSDLDLVDEALNATEINVEIGNDVEHLEIPDTNPFTDLTTSIYDFSEFDKDVEFKIVDFTSETEVPCNSQSSVYITENDVDFYDNRGEHYSFKYFFEGYGEGELTISKSLFEEDKVYYLELKNDALAFKNKDSDIRKLTFYTLNINEDTRERNVEYKENIPNLDINKVYYFDEDGYSPFFIYSDAEDLKDIEENQTFRITHLDANSATEIEKDNIDTTYGNLLSVQKNPNGAGMMVRYQAAKANDIFKNFTIKDFKTINEDDIIDIFVDDDETVDQIVQGMIHSGTVVTTMYGFMKYFDVKPHQYKSAAYDWGSRIDIKLDIDYDPNTATFSIGISGMYTFYPDNNITISLKLGYTQSWRFDVTADVSIETEFLFPVGVDYTLQVVENTVKKAYFGIYITWDNYGEYDEEKTKEEVQKAIQEARDCDSNWKKSSVFKGAEPYETKNGTSYPLFKISCVYFEPVEIYFEVDFYWEVNPSAEFVVSYTSHTQRVDLCVSNEGGAVPSSESATQTDESLEFHLVGSIHAEIGFRLSVGISIMGLYRFFHVELYLKIYGAIDIQGFITGDVVWSETEPATAGMSLGCRFEVSVGLKVGIDLYLLFGGINFEIPVVAVVLFGVGIDFPIQHFIHDEEDTYIKDTDYDKDKNRFNSTLGERHLLTVSYLNTKEFVSDIKDMEFSDKYKAVYGAFVPEDVDIPMFKVKSIEITEKEEVCPDPVVSITDEGYIGLETIEGMGNFVAKVTIQATKQVTLDRDLTKVINVHFTNNNRQNIYIDDVLYGKYVDGAVITLPVPEPVKYKKFTGYTYTDILGYEVKMEYDPNDPTSLQYVVSTYEGAIPEWRFYTDLVDYYHWEVYFLDGLNNIVSKQMVLFGEAAVEPDPEIRDKFMLQNPPDDKHHYEFVSWDTDFSRILGPTVVRGIYKIVSN